MTGRVPRARRGSPQRGQGSVEYTLVLAMICLYAVMVLGFIRLELGSVFDSAARLLAR